MISERVVNDAQMLTCMKVLGVEIINAFALMGHRTA